MRGCALKHEAMLVCCFAMQASEILSNCTLLFQRRCILILGRSSHFLWQTHGGLNFQCQFMSPASAHDHGLEPSLKQALLGLSQRAWLCLLALLAHGGWRPLGISCRLVAIFTGHTGKLGKLIQADSSPLSSKFGI